MADIYVRSVSLYLSLCKHWLNVAVQPTLLIRNGRPPMDSMIKEEMVLISSGIVILAYGGGPIIFLRH